MITIDEADQTNTRCRAAVGCLMCGMLVLIILFLLWWVLGAFKTSAGDLLRDIYERLTGEKLTCEDLFALFLASLLGALMACCYCCFLVFWYFGRKAKQYDRFEDEDVAKEFDIYMTCILHVSGIIRTLMWLTSYTSRLTSSMMVTKWRCTQLQLGVCTHLSGLGLGLGLGSWGYLHTFTLTLTLA